MYEDDFRSKTKAIIVVVSLCIIIILGYFGFRWVSPEFKDFNNKDKGIVSNSWAFAFEREIINGVEVKSLISLAVSNDVAVAVKTIASKDFAIYNKDNSYGINNVNNVNYINPQGHYKKSFIKNSNGVIIKVTLEQLKS